MEALTPGLATLVGQLELRVVDCEASFEVTREANDTGDALHPASVVVPPPGGVVGCNPDADWRVAGTAARGVSRRHLVLRATDAGWTARDCSSNGTFEWIEDDEARWARLPANLAVPLHDGVRLSLGPELRLRVKLLAKTLPPNMTPRMGPPRPAGSSRVRPPELELLAAALLAPRRAGRRDLAVPPLSELLEELNVARSTLYEHAKRLRALPEVKPHVEGRGHGLDDTADAVAHAFPYLLGEA